MSRRDAVARIAGFLKERQQMRGVDPSVIAQVQGGSSREAILTVEDLSALLPTAVTRDELLRAMDAWGACGFVVDDRAVAFLNYFLGVATPAEKA